MNRRQKKKQKVDHFAEFRDRLNQVKEIKFDRYKENENATVQTVVTEITPETIDGDFTDRINLTFVPLPEPKVDAAPTTSRVEQR